MVTADPKNAIIRKQVNSITFGFYTDEDVRARAVVEVTSPQAFDAMGTPLPRGLYDHKFGPFDKFGPPCVTCACSYSTCPGHAGVVELCVPVYHPILFPLVVKLLRAKCLACHKFRIAATPLEIVKCKYYLLQQGRLQEALELDATLAQASQTKLTDGANTTKTAISAEAIDRVLAEKQNSHTENSNVQETSYDREMKRGLFKELLSSCMGAKKCPHCGAFSPKIRQDEHNKIFQSKLAATNVRINAAEGITLQPALGSVDDEDDTTTMEDDDADDDADNTTSDELKRDKFMHALEVEAQVRLTWESDPILCNYLFGGGATDGYKIFFMRAIPVPPSRFRPPMMMGSLTVENAQNQHLNKLLVANDRIRTLMAAVEDSTKSQTQALSTWIDLQTTVNVHFDSSKDPRAGGAANNGIRQILEKKEGIFRKHMMGKRVDFCCRSVISPDPYIGTDEIGIPLHFAKALTFPTPVSNLNIEEMRALIIRGPENYPGAVWVQFPDGRKVDLLKMDATKREGISARLLTLLKRGGAPPIVGRQLRNGDMVLANRQVSKIKDCVLYYVVERERPRKNHLVMHHSEVYSMLDYDIYHRWRIRIEICAPQCRTEAFLGNYTLVHFILYPNLNANTLLFPLVYYSLRFTNLESWLTLFVSCTIQNKRPSECTTQTVTPTMRISTVMK
jgi:DNA-directed RNA polymerase I subunit RPA1